MPYLGIFGLEFEKNTVIFETASLYLCCKKLEKHENP